MSKITKRIDPDHLKSGLAEFRGSDQFYHHGINRRLIYTDGVRYLAENAHAYWLIDLVASYVGSREWHTACQQDIRFASMSFWTLTVLDPEVRNAHASARVDRDCPALISQHIEYTDFPLEEITLYLAASEQGWTLMLPSEY